MSALARAPRAEMAAPADLPATRTLIAPRTLLTIAVVLLLAAAVAGAGYLAMAEPRPDLLRSETFWLAFGWTAQLLFTARFLVQWLAAERAGQAVIPPAFWWLSLAGGLALGIYFISRRDPVGAVGQMAPVAIYARNLFLIHRSEHPAHAPQPARA